MLEISILTKKEIEAHDYLIHLTQAVSKLSPNGKEKVYQRWLMLKMMTPDELEWFKRLLSRVSQPTSDPSQVVMSKGGTTLA